MSKPSAFSFQHVPLQAVGPFTGLQPLTPPRSRCALPLKPPMPLPTHRPPTTAAGPDRPRLTTAHASSVANFQWWCRRSDPWKPALAELARADPLDELRESGVLSQCVAEGGATDPVRGNIPLRALASTQISSGGELQCMSLYTGPQVGNGSASAPVGARRRSAKGSTGSGSIPRTKVVRKFVPE